MQALPVGMRQLQAEGVKREAVESVLFAKKFVDVALAVAYITNNRMAEVLEVVSYLVPASRARESFHKRPPSAMCDWPKFRNSRYADATLLARDGMIQVTGVSHRATHEGQILFYDLPALELLLKRSCGPGI